MQSAPNYIDSDFDWDVINDIGASQSSALFKLTTR